MFDESAFTKEQLSYIKYIKKNDTKLLATAGSGKSHCIVNKMNYLIVNNLYKPDEILMLTFSRFTRDDFINKIKKLEIENIQEKQIKTIDSFAKTIIDEKNEIDVTLLSYKFMKYLEISSTQQILDNIKLNSVKCIFVDEAQDLNEVQYKILMYLKEKNGTIINLIGDPNQNIYQFRNSSDKFLTDFKAKTFYLTKNFRSYGPIVEFSKHLRPIKDLDVQCQLGSSDCLPNFFFHENDSDLENSLVMLINNAKRHNIDYSEIAILSPTRGRMMGYGRSHGLCFVSNLLYKNNIKFKQFYEEAIDDQQSAVKYCPKKGHINLLTYMGSKGLEWKFVILVDADVCLINKRSFSDQKHKNDQYLLYVACSRAVNNMVIFSKYKCFEGNFTFQLNPWFDLIPKQCYTMSENFKKFFKYPKINHKVTNENERRTTKLLDKISEELLDELSTICKYGTAEKTVEKIYNKDFSTTITSNLFLGKYVENLFNVYYFMARNKEKKKYIDIENIINKSIITNVPVAVNEWFYRNREYLTWEKFDEDKIDGKIDEIIVETVNKKFNRNQPLKDHTIVNDGYFNAFILSLREKIKETYTKYMSTTNTQKIKKYLFDIMVILYSLETQHYFHALNKGKKFKNILVACDELFDNVKKFAYETSMIFTQQSVSIEDENLIGEIDLISESDEIWEIKCTADISLKHVLQVLIYNLIKHDYNQENSKINVNFINFLKGDKITFYINLTQQEIERIKEIFILTINKPSDASVAVTNIIANPTPN